MKRFKLLYAPESYWQTAPEDRARVTNGCGPGGWKIDLVPDTIYGLSIREACNIHDWMYTFGTSTSDKAEADRVMLNNCIRLVNHDRSFFGRLLKRPRLLRCREYFEAVQHFGGPAFWAGKNDPATEREVA